jgi:hypothetical protein
MILCCVLDIFTSPFLTEINYLQRGQAESYEGGKKLANRNRGGTEVTYIGNPGTTFVHIGIVSLSLFFFPLSNAEMLNFCLCLHGQSSLEGVW